MAFYQRGFGLELLAEDTFASGKEEGRYEAILGLKGATAGVALLKGVNLQLELFEFASPAPKRTDPKRPVCDHGITHFCVEVTDIEHEYQRLRAAGATFHFRP